MFFDHQHSKTAIALALGAVLAGCGGGGGGGPSGPSSQLTAACSGTACGAANATTYSGQGVGVWSYTNTTQAEQQIPVGLTNLGSKQVTLIYTNNGDASVPMPALTLTPPAATTATAQKSLSAAPATVNRIPERIRNFKPRLTAADMQARQSIKPQAAAILPVGSQRSWFVQPGDSRIEARQATLRRQASVPTPTGTRTINVWLEDSEYDAAKVSDAMLDTLLQRFTSGSDAVYPLITGLSGEPWGAHSYSDLIDPEQPLDIVFVNFVPDRTPYGLLGYFWSLNNFKQDPANPDLKYSNQSLSFYMDTETLYLDPAEGMTNQISTLSHEFVHMTNFYRRSVQLSKPGTDYAFDTFLEEMSAMMGEDIVAQRVTPGFNSIANGRVPSWLSRSGFNCDPAAWSADTAAPCFGYDVNGSLGAYLVRQYGVGFYKQLLSNTTSTDSLQVLGNAIQQAGGPTLPVAIQRWGANIALLPGDVPSGYGWPARTEQGFTLAAINGSSLASSRVLPTTVPVNLNARGHFPFLRQPDAQGTYQEQLRVPAGSTLTAVVR
ncbi:hemagglutinin [Delftia tsuruhatensis]|uniref:M30 family zinc metallopeptidase n=1 Tax=Delftia tsuruhatensis TaxID=180282 RepID=UPI00124893BB|nr:hemagglutinin [Delftia tsuruhatensis]KAA9160133.1 hemagglutinin [Delftia sp. BR1]MDH0773736.1 hemagglutinin [Delftia tsuruhatensis]MDH1458325.1 hemagglutinin [Delftia tsuruhatensis]MDH1822222.1 hemagglutinin [Delftia tsuruhatensis]WGG11249.1 hemagglutinin [Delftia tsuruhatensis]